MSTAPATVADVIALAPELADASSDPATSANFALIVDVYSLCTLVPAHWGEKFTQAHASMAAHILTLCYNPAGVSGGAVSGRSIDKIAESYATGTFEDTELGQTKHGRLHLLQRKALMMTSRAVSEGNLPPDFSLPDQRIH